MVTLRNLYKTRHRLSFHNDYKTTFVLICDYCVIIFWRRQKNLYHYMAAFCPIVFMQSSCHAIDLSSDYLITIFLITNMHCILLRL